MPRAADVGRCDADVPDGFAGSPIERHSSSGRTARRSAALVSHALRPFAPTFAAMSRAPRTASAAAAGASSQLPSSARLVGHS